MINTLHNGDCLKIMPEIPDKSVNCIICDLPYGTTDCKWDTVIPFEPLWIQYKRVIKDNGAIVLFGGEPFSSFLRCSAIDIYRYDWIWKKKQPCNFLFGNKQPLKLTEQISVFYKKQPTYNAIKRDLLPNQHSSIAYPRDNSKFSKEIMSNLPDGKSSSNYVPNKRLPTNILEYVGVRLNNSKNKIHPTQKPLDLIEYLIRTYTNPNDLVLDNCFGSGTTIVGCINLNRNYVGIEQDKTYFESAGKRIEQSKRDKQENLFKC